MVNHLREEKKKKNRGVSVKVGFLRPPALKTFKNGAWRQRTFLLPDTVAVSSRSHLEEMLSSSASVLVLHLKLDVCFLLSARKTFPPAPSSSSGETFQRAIIQTNYPVA